MNRINKIIICGLLLCLLGAAGKGYGQEVEPRTVLAEEDLINKYKSQGPKFDLYWDVDLKTNPKTGSYYNFGGTPISSSSGLVYFIGGVNQPIPEPCIVCINEFSGKEIWRWHSDIDVHGFAAILNNKNNVIAIGSNTILEIDGRSGIELKKYKLPKLDKDLILSEGISVSSYGSQNISYNKDNNKLYYTTKYRVRREEETTFAFNALDLSTFSNQRFLEFKVQDYHTQPALIIKDSHLISYLPGPRGSTNFRTEKLVCYSLIHNKLMWERGFDRENYSEQNPQINDSCLFFSSGNNLILIGQGFLEKFDIKNGKTIFKKNISTSEGGHSMGRYVVVDKDYNFYTSRSNSGIVSSFNLKGENLFKYSIKTNMDYPLTLCSEGVLLCFEKQTDAGLNIIGLRRGTGEKVFHFDISNKLSSRSYVLTKNGHFVAASGSRIFCYKTELTPSDSSQSMSLSDNRRSNSITSSSTAQLIADSNKKEVGDHIKFVAYGGGGEKVTYKFLFDDTTLYQGSSNVIKMEGLSINDSGEYSVRILHGVNEISSNILKVDVSPKGKPRMFIDNNEALNNVVFGDKAEITLSTSFEGGAIFYTLDGSEPSFESTPYQSPFTVSKTTGIRAVAYKKDFSDLAEADPVFINIVPNYDLNVSVQGQGTVVKAPGPYMQDSVVKLKAIPKEGWRFAGWSDALKSSFEEGSVVMGGNKSVTAKFEEIPKYKLSDLTRGGGLINGIPKSVIKPQGKFVISFDLKKTLTPEVRKFPNYDHDNLWVTCCNNSPFIYIRKKRLGSDIPMNTDPFWEDNKTPGILVKTTEGIFGWNPKFKEWGRKSTAPLEGVWRDIAIDGSFSSFEIVNNTIEEIFIEEVYLQANGLEENEKYSFSWLASNLSLFYLSSELVLKVVPDEGYKFLGWSGDATGTNPELTLTMDRDKTVEAVFGTDLATTATGKGKLIIDPPTGPYPYGTKVNINPVPDDGYYLGVWGGDAFGLPKGPIEYEIAKANPEITALFVPLKENRFTVTTLTSSGGSVNSNPNSNAYVNGQAVTLTATPEPGYSFVGWTGDIESTDNPLVTLANANKTVTAEFRRNIIAPVTLTINAENGTVTRTPSDELYEKGTSVELLAQPNPGYTFTGWAGALEGTASRVTLFLDGDKSVTANFKASYQLATETRGPGGVLITPSSTTFIDGDEVILTASPAEGYGFVGWTGDLESTDQQTTLAMNSNKRVIAHFAQLGTLTTWSRGEGTITRSPDKESYFPGASVTLTATAGDGFQFVNWDGQASGTANPTTVTMDRAMSVAANFRDIKAPTVTITSPVSQETGEETFDLSGNVSDNGKIKSLVWLWKGNEMGELELTEGKFSLEDQKLVGGANDITVVATDRSGNEGKATATPVWTPNRSIRIAVATEQQEGNRIEVPIEINSKGDVGGMGFVLNYNHSYLMDPVLTWSSAAGGSINLVNEDVAGELRGTFSLGGTSLPAGEQLIGTVSFRARSVPENLETAIGLMDISVSDPAGAIFESGTDVVSGQARVLVRGITGDNNANDRLDVGDATRIQRLLVRMDIARAWDVSGNDLNGNGALDPGDVTKVLRAVVGIDPQPNRNRVITKMGGDDDEVETVVLSIKEKTADTVTVQVQLKDMQSTIAGANFQLEYPTELLRLKDRTSHRAGEMVAGNAAAIWNVSPAQTDYSKQDGTLAMAVSSPEPWTVKDGVLAELTFDVQDGADLNRAVLALSEVEVTPDGFDNRMISGLEFNVGSGGDVKQPNEPVLRDITNAPFSFRFDTEPNRDYSIEGSGDLKAWDVLEQFKSTKRSHQFSDPRNTVFQHQYYRVTVE